MSVVSNNYIFRTYCNQESLRSVTYDVAIISIKVMVTHYTEKVYLTIAVIVARVAKNKLNKI